MDPIYTIEASGYICTLQGARVEVGAEVALCFDKAASVLLKHGRPDLVQDYYATARKRFSDAGFADMAEDLVCITGAFDLDELNKVVSICDYIGRFYRQLDAKVTA